MKQQTLSVLIALSICVLTKGQHTELTNLIYQTIKQTEKDFPRPAPLDTIFVGQFFVNSGSFEGLTSTTMEKTGPLGKTITVHIPGRATSKTVASVLKFSIDKPGDIFRVTVNNKSYFSGNNKKDLFVPVSSNEKITWAIEQGSKKYRDNLKIERLIIGVGACTIPYIPMSILYAPPKTNSNQNISLYTTTEAIGTILSLSTSKEAAVTKTVLTGLNVFNNILDGGIAATKDAPDPKAQAINQALQKIKAVFGNEQITETVGSIRNDELVINANNMISITYSTPVPTEGAGHSDRFILLVKPRVLWMVRNGVLTYSILDFEMVDRPTFDQIKESNDSFLHALITLYPLAILRGSKPGLPRFSRVDVPITNVRPGDSMPVTITRQQIVTTRSSNTQYTTTMEDYSPGYLSYLGIGDEAKKIKQTFSSSALREVNKASTEVNTFIVVNKTNKDIVIEVFYDNAFGGILIYQIPDLQLAPAADAILKDANGEPMKNVKALLKTANGSYAAITDKNGHYSIRMEKSNHSTSGILIVNNKSTPIKLKTTTVN